jgi:polysaccharide biosynthesis protein PslF
MLDIVVIEHEYGIFGGRDGDYILDFAQNLKKPLVTTLHTVLAKPSKNQRRILQELSRQSHHIVTMAQFSKKLLINIYGIPADKIQVIPHGVPFIQTNGTQEELKCRAGLAGRTVLSTFGLLNPGKGIEYAIQAAALVAKAYPDIIYLVLGRTHPCVKENFGEAYREKLEKLVSLLDIEKQVRFVDRYLTKNEIADYLFLSDIYVTPYLCREQAVSGTLAYAAGYGKAIVSTPYSYAKEMLAQGRGLLAAFADADSLAQCILELLQNPAKKARMEYLMQRMGRTMLWEQVAWDYVRVFSGLQGQMREDMAG